MKCLIALLLLLPSLAFAGSLTPPGSNGQFIYNNSGSFGAASNPAAMSKISSGIFVDPRNYGAVCDGATFSPITGRPVQNGTDNDTAGFLAAAVAAQAVGGAVLVPDGCWISGLALSTVKGAAFVGQGWAPNYGYDYGTNSQPYTRPVLYIIGAPSLGIDVSNTENIAFVGFEINANSNSSAFGNTSCIGSTSGVSGFGGKIWLNYMSIKGCNIGYGPNGGYVYTVSENSDYGGNTTGISGSTSDFLSMGDTFASNNIGINLTSNSGGFVRIIGDRLEYTLYGIYMSGNGEVSLIGDQFDHSANCALFLSGTHDVNISNGAMRWSGVNGSLQVTGAANNGSGLVRLTVNGSNSPVTSALTTGNTVTVSGVTGTTEANGYWTLTVVDSTHIDLQGSSYSHTYVSGGYAGVTGMDADICMQNGTQGVHAENVGFYSGSWMGAVPAPAYIMETETSDIDYIEVIGGIAQSIASASAINYSSYSIGMANYGPYTAPAHTHYDAQGSALFRDDNSQFSIGTSGVGIGTSSPNNTLDVEGTGIKIGSGTPSPTTNDLYAVGSSLYWNGTLMGGTAGVTSINSTSGAFTFTGSGVSCTTTTCTFSGGGTSLLGTSLTATNPQISGDATSGLLTPSAHTIQIAGSGEPIAEFDGNSLNDEYFQISGGHGSYGTVSLTAYGSGSDSASPINMNIVSANGGVVKINGNTALAGTSTGLTMSGSVVSSTAEQTLSFQPGLLTTIVGTKSVYAKFKQASTVDNLEGSAMSLTCTTNPTITMYECGTSATCASPTTIGTVTVTASGTVVDGSVSNGAIAAGDYIAFAITAGACTALDIAATAQAHSN